MKSLLRTYWKPLAALLLVVSLCAGSAWLASIHTDDQWQKRWQARDLADAQAAIQFADKQRRIEQERQGAIDAIQEQAQQEIATAQRNAAIAAAESDRLQHGIEQAIAKIRAGGSNTSTTTSSTTRDKASVLLAELFREIDTAAGNYAAEADRAYDAGRRCEAAYNAVRATSQQ